MNTRKWLWVLLFSLLIMQPGRANAQATTPTPLVTKVTVTVLDENGDPAAYLPIEINLFRYAESVEVVGVGGCGTDESGSCAVLVSNPPNVDGWMEGMIFIPGLGTKYIGWQGAETEVVIRLLPGNVMATPETFLHPPFDEQPKSTDLPLGLAWVETLTLTPTTLPSETPTPTETTAPVTNDVPTSTSTATLVPGETVDLSQAPPTVAISESPPSAISPLTGLIIAFTLPVLGLITYWWVLRRSKSDETDESENEDTEDPTV